MCHMQERQLNSLTFFKKNPSIMLLGIFLVMDMYFKFFYKMCTFLNKNLTNYTLNKENNILLIHWGNNQKIFLNVLFIL